jgi:hypothetical protein
LSKLFVDEIQPKTTGGVINAKGMVIQMPFTQYTSTTTVSISANTDTVISVLTVNITPSSTSSIIRLDTHIFPEWANGVASAESCWFFYRDSTKLAAPQAGSRRSGISVSSLSHHNDAGSTPEIAYYSYFDAPNTTNQITYKIGVNNYYANNVVINRTINDTDQNQAERGISFISATEIGG